MNLLPHFVRSGWAMLPLEVLRAFSGHSSLPVHELDKFKVQTPHRRLRPLPLPSSHLPFTAWQFAHALKKADCARWPSSHLLWIGAAGFLLEQVHLFDWNSRELRLSAGMSDFYADFSRTSLSGRIGQGMAVLFLERLGYRYLGRFSSMLLRHGRDMAALRSLRNKRVRIPDFIMEAPDGARALAEAKGSFVPFANRSDLKGVLRQALQQLDGWDQAVIPQPQKGFAVGTFLRETDDPSKEPSLVAFVDPPPGELVHPVEIPEDAVPLANYASWLHLMGFENAARRLLTGEREPELRTVPILTIGRHKYVVTIASVQPTYGDASREPEFLKRLLDWLYWPTDPYRDEVSLALVGLDLDVVRRLGPPFTKREFEGQIVVSDERDSDVGFEGGQFLGSVFSDGSLLGEIRITRAGFSSIDWQELEL